MNHYFLPLKWLMSTIALGPCSPKICLVEDIFSEVMLRGRRAALSRA